MATGKVSREYDVQLSVEQDTKTLKTVMQTQQAFQSISDAASALDFEAAQKGLSDINKKLEEARKSQKDFTSEAKAYYNSVNKSLTELDKQQRKILYTQSEQGQNDKKRLEELRAERAAIKANNAEHDLAKDKLKELQKLEERIVDGTEAELAAQSEHIKGLKVQLQLSREQMKLQIRSEKLGKTARDLAREDLKAWRERVRAVREYWKGLSKSGKAYAVLTKAGRAAGKAAIAGGVGAAGVVAGAVGAAYAGADKAVQREQALQRFGGSLTENQKAQFLSDLYIRTGADYSTIVGAIGNVQNILGKQLSYSDLMTATIAELRSPGAAALFQTQTGDASVKDLAIYANRVRAIQKETGASVEDVTAAAGFASNLRNRQLSTASQTDVQALYLALQASGAFDSASDMETALNRFLTRQAQSGKDIWTFAQEYDWTRGVYSQTARNQLEKGIASIDFGALRGAAHTTEGELRTSAAEKAAEQMRKFEERKNQLLAGVLERTVPLLDEFLSWAQRYLPPFMVDFLRWIKADEATIRAAQAYEQTTRESLMEEMQPLLDRANAYIERLYDEGTFDRGTVDYLQKEMSKAVTVKELEQALRRIKPGARSFYEDLESDTLLAQKATGGIFNAPAVVGERGPELAIPLSHSMAGRAGDIVQNITQTITLRNSPSSLTFSKAIQSKAFNKAAFAAHINPL